MYNINILTERMAKLMKGLLHLLKIILKAMWKLGIIGWDDVANILEQYGESAE